MCRWKSVLWILRKAWEDEATLYVLTFRLKSHHEAMNPHKLVDPWFEQIREVTFIADYQFLIRNNSFTRKDPHHWDVELLPKERCAYLQG